MLSLKLSFFMPLQYYIKLIIMLNHFLI